VRSEKSSKLTMPTPSRKIGRGRHPTEDAEAIAHTPVRALEVTKNGQLRPMTYTSSKSADVRWVSGQFLASLNNLWERRGDEILDRCADEHPELVMMCMTKIAQVQRIEVGNPGDFSGLDKKGIVEKLEQRAGPKAKKLFEKFISDMQKLREEPGGVGDNGSADA
jgi:hypothetical protein